MVIVKPLTCIIYIMHVFLSCLLFSLRFYIFIFYIISFTICYCVSFYSHSVLFFFHFTLFGRFRTKGRPRDSLKAYEGSQTRALWLQNASFVLMIHEKSDSCEGRRITIGIGFCATDKLQVVCDWTGNHLLLYLASDWVTVFVTSARGKWHNKIRNYLVSKSITSRKNVVVKNHLLLEN